ncbi:SRPBCC family protein [Flavobacterium sp.]|uniref:SRPBCC family protein n=1 Tax=Flavobacterium sp. TaxID=239 RepID=UPI00121D918D|nr:SRPBCC family protein [Flavobacterium sp.]RZJ70062.1 MAG: cell division protein [Flavobacterium sp.]
MTILKFKTTIDASVQTVFDLSRSVDLHLESTSQTDEKVVGGKMSGLMELGETVTWRAKHFGFYLTHESKITQMTDGFFVDEMISGHFKSFRHEHFFTVDASGLTEMTDLIRYGTPFGIFGWIFDGLLLEAHLRKLIENRNLCIKRAAEKT